MNVSVIVPLYNKEKFIQRTLQSILNQTYRDFEVIIVDDGSTDKSAEVAETIKDHRIKIHRQKNKGPGSARNEGARLSRGKYLAFLDADDEWKPQFLENLIACLEKNPECSAATSQLEIFPKDAAKRRATFYAGLFTMSKEIDEFKLRDIINQMYSSATVCRKATFNILGGFFENHCTYGEDNFFWVQVLFHSQVYFVPDPLIVYHTEASELSLGKNSVFSPLPLVTHSSIIKRTCPQEHKKILDKLIMLYGERDFKRQKSYHHYLTATVIFFKAGLYKRFYRLW